MAVDNASKRFSMMNFGTVPTSPIFIPDGTVDAGDEYHLLNLYYGISLDSPVAITIIPDKRFMVNIGKMGLR